MSKHRRLPETKHIIFKEVETKVRMFLPPYFFIWEIWIGDKKLAETVVSLEFLLDREKQKKILRGFFGGPVKCLR
jgi:hypothetical protein